LNVNLYLQQGKIFRIEAAENEYIFHHYTILYKFYDFRVKLKNE